MEIIEMLVSVAEVPRSSFSSSRAPHTAVGISNAHLASKLTFKTTSLTQQACFSLLTSQSVLQLTVSSPLWVSSWDEAVSKITGRCTVSCPPRLFQISVTKPDRCLLCVSAGANLAHTECSYIICSGHSLIAILTIFLSNRVVEEGSHGIL